MTTTYVIKVTGPNGKSGYYFNGMIVNQGGKEFPSEKAAWRFANRIVWTHSPKIEVIPTSEATNTLL